MADQFEVGNVVAVVDVQTRTVVNRTRIIDAVTAARCGYSIDYSGPVNDRACLHIDNCYYIPNLKLISHRCKTNTQSATAFRGFGGPQGMFGIETVIEEIANDIGKDPLDVRLLNIYKDPAVSGNPATMVTQYGQTIADWVGDKVIDQVASESKYLSLIHI